jgi:hypothetical protein
MGHESTAYQRGEVKARMAGTDGPSPFPLSHETVLQLWGVLPRLRSRTRFPRAGMPSLQDFGLRGAQSGECQNHTVVRNSLCQKF